MGGTKNCPETPRQRMIGMMYLVLIALLALNVSSEILNGFTLVDDSLHTSTLSIDEQNRRLYQEFHAMYAENPQKVGEWLEKAKIVQREADELFNAAEENAKWRYNSYKRLANMYNVTVNVDK